MRMGAHLPAPELLGYVSVVVPQRVVARARDGAALAPALPDRAHLPQSGRAALPKTSKAERMAQNRAIYDFTLTDDEMAAIDALGTTAQRRTCPDPASVT